MTGAEERAAFVAEAAGSLVAQGFPRIPASVLMALVASERGQLESRELIESLQVSAAAISGATRYLTTVGFVRVGTVPGTRRHVYALTEPAWYTTTFTNSARFREFARVVQPHLARFPAESGAGRRIAEMADFFRFLDERLPSLLDEWRASYQPRSRAQ